MTRFIAILGLSVFIATGTTGGAFAQAASNKAKTENIKPAEAAPPALIAPYDQQLMRLSEVLGAIHFLRELCHANEGQLWRSKMSALISAEQPRPSRRAKMIARFNRGYGAYNSSYSSCTTAALVAVKRYMKEGVRLSSQITTRYGR